VVAVEESSDDLSFVVDAEGFGAIRAVRIVERGVVTIVVEEAVVDACAVAVSPNDLAVVVPKAPVPPRGSSSVMYCPFGSRRKPCSAPALSQ
jgi:hypothetical protein